MTSSGFRLTAASDTYIAKKFPRAGAQVSRAGSDPQPERKHRGIVVRTLW